jgi:copper chaperone CopZ
VAIRSETIQVSGIRCERCVLRLAGALQGLEGLESANANLMGQVALSWDDERTSRQVLVERLSRSGFPELPPVP